MSKKASAYPSSHLSGSFACFNSRAVQALLGMALLVFAMGAQALGLGRLTVQSALGEPLRAEIEITDITAEEAASLNVRVAGPEAFRAAGIEYNALLSNLRITLQRRPDGKPFLALNAFRPVQDPFLDLILEANWASGRLVRDYTMLFDPPALRSQAPGGRAAPQAVLPPVSSPAAAPAPTTPTDAASARAARQQQAREAKLARDAERQAAREAAREAAQAKAAERAAQGSQPAKSARAEAPGSATPAPASGDSYVVKQGDTLGKIADQYRGEAASLDQMLLALFRANPEAFSGQNINRLKAGAVLRVPTADEAAKQSTTAEARQTVAAQSRDFAEYRRSLAALAPGAAPEGNTQRAATGKVDVKVDDARKATAAADKLKLEKGGVAGKSADAVAADRAKAEANTRVAELNRNLADINKAAAAAGVAGSPGAPASTPNKGAGPAVSVGAPSTPTAAVAASPAASASKAASPSVAASAVAPTTTSSVATPSKPVGATATGVASASAATSPAVSISASAPPAATASQVTVASGSPTVTSTAGSPTTSAASTPTTSATASANTAATSTAAVPTATPAPAAPKVAVTPPPPPPEPSLLDDLMENPLVPAAAAGVVALLAGFGVYRMRQRKSTPAAGVDSSFLESRLQPDSFFGASGGQRVDTKDGALSGSSMVYSPSQLEAAGDVDPVAEADVYLAYGRDLQAEEILKEAIKTQPDRVSVRVKLLEIYAKRRDARGFEALAASTYGLAGADSPDWERIREMGVELEPSNPLYQPGATPVAAAPRSGGRASGEPTPSMLSPSTLPNPFSATAAAEPQAVPPSDLGSDLDLDLDFSLPDDTAPVASSPVIDTSMAATQPLNVSVSAEVAQAPAAPDISFDLNVGASEPTMRIEPQPLAATSPTAAEPTVKMAAADAPLEFDAGLSFDLPSAGGAPAAPVAANPSPADDGNALSFDLSGISLDLPAASAAPAVASAVDDLVSDADTKLALAEEFRQIGDVEAARQLVSEVLASASGDAKAKAQRLLADLG